MVPKQNGVGIVGVEVSARSPITPAHSGHRGPPIHPSFTTMPVPAVVGVAQKSTPRSHADVKWRADVNECVAMGIL